MSRLGHTVQWSLLAAAQLVTLLSKGQDLGSIAPRGAKEIVVDLELSYGGMVNFSHFSGPYALMEGRNALGWGFGARYRQRFGTDKRSLLGFGLDYLRLPFTFTWYVNANEVYGIERSSGEETYLAERMGLMTAWVTFERELHARPDPVSFFAGLGLGYSQLDFYPIFGYNTVSPYDDPGRVYVLYDMTSDHRDGFVPLLRMGLQKEWTYANKNRLGLLAYVQWSPVDDFNSGTYLAYPGTTSESRGTWNQGLNYVGLKVHYAMGFGPGKVPKHLRTNE